MKNKSKRLGTTARLLMVLLLAGAGGGCQADSGAGDTERPVFVEGDSVSHVVVERAKQFLLDERILPDRYTTQTRRLDGEWVVIFWPEPSTPCDFILVSVHDDGSVRSSTLEWLDRTGQRVTRSQSQLCRPAIMPLIAVIRSFVGSRPDVRASLL